MLVFSVLFLLAIISLSLHFYVVFEFLYQYIDVIFNTGESSSSFFSWHIYSMSSLGCKALWIDMNFLVLWSICLSSPFAYFKKNSLDVYYFWWDFCDYSLVSSSFLVLRRNPLKIFFHLSLFDDVRFQYSQVFVSFLFSEHSDFFLGLVVLFVLSCVVSCFSLLACRIFLCRIPSQCPGCIFSLPLWRFPILFHFWRTVWCRPCTLGDWSFHVI